MQLKAELVSAWLEKAAHDLGSAKVLFRHSPEFEDTIAFHCQQCVEKVLKAFLVWQDVYPPKTHDLLKLTELLKSHAPELSQFEEDMQDLTYFAVAVRYPDAELPANLPILHLLSVSEKISITIKQLLAENGYSGTDSSSNTNNTI